MIAPIRAPAGALAGCLLTAAMLALPAGAWAQRVKPPPLIQEAFIGDLAFTQARGEIQISSLIHAAGASARRTARVPLEIEYGITDAIEVSVETGGFNYARPSAWSSPSEFGVGLRYGRYGLLPNLHASVTLAAESEIEDFARMVHATSGLQLGVDIPRLRMSHIFTSATGGVWSSNGSQAEVRWVAGVVVPVGRLRATVERTLTVSDAATRGTVPGLVWKVVDGVDVGVATTVHAERTLRATGVMLSLLVEF